MSLRMGCYIYVNVREIKAETSCTADDSPYEHSTKPNESVFLKGPFRNNHRYANLNKTLFGLQIHIMKPSKWKITVKKNWVKSPERSIYTSWRSLRHPDFRTGLEIDTGWWCSYLGLPNPFLKIYFSIGSIFHFLNLKKKGYSWWTCFLNPDIIHVRGNQSQVHFISNVPRSHQKKD